MKTLIVLTGAVLTLVGISFQFAAAENNHGLQLAQAGEAKPAQQKAPATAKPADKPKAANPLEGVKADKPVEAKKPANAEKPAAESKGDPQPGEDNKANPENHFAAVPEKFAADEKAVREVHSALTKAYATDDAKAAAAHFTADAEYINGHDTIFRGRTEIEQSLTDYMAEHPGCKLESEIVAIRFVSPQVALVDGESTITHEEDRKPSHCRFEAVYVKADGKWQIASVHDQHGVSIPTHEEQLAELDFLQGEWVDEADDSVVSFNTHPTDNGKFLLREFTLKLAGHDALSGTQRIGWDPVSGQLRTWIFDSDGGFAEGVWQRSGDDWIMQASGVTSDGEIASGTSIYKIVNDHTMTWQSVDYEIGGVRVPDGPVFTLTHRAPSPTPQEAKAEVKADAKADAKAGTKTNVGLKE